MRKQVIDLQKHVLSVKSEWQTKEIQYRVRLTEEQHEDDLIVQDIRWLAGANKALLLHFFRLSLWFDIEDMSLRQ